MSKRKRSEVTTSRKRRRVETQDAAPEFWAVADSLVDINDLTDHLEDLRKHLFRVRNIVAETHIKMEQLCVALEKDASILKYRDDIECVVCKTELTLRWCMNPCGHTIVCGRCANKVKSCPVCKTDIIEYIKLY
jgi:hypothetical protein